MNNLLELSQISDSAIHSALKTKWEAGSSGIELGPRGLVQMTAVKEEGKVKDFAIGMYKQMVREQKDQVLFFVCVLLLFLGVFTSCQ